MNHGVLAPRALDVMKQSDLDAWHMSHALELAMRGQGAVEPNPMVGAVVVRGAEIIGEGWHRAFGRPHAEIDALRVAGPRASGATLYVTLEPCCHHGKTPPCSDAVIQAGVSRVVVAQPDPFPAVDGGGIRALQDAGIEVTVGVRQAEAERLNAPYLKLVQQNRPWVIAKWAMTLDGKIATSEGNSRWISGESSRKLVHQLRGRVDAIIVGRRTAELDDPLLTARPPGSRVATRIVFDSRAKLRSDSQLVRTVADAPVLVVVTQQAEATEVERLKRTGCEVFLVPTESPETRIGAVLEELGRRRMTNVLVEGGAQLFGSFLDADQFDEVFAFVAPKLVGGADSPSPLAGRGIPTMREALTLVDVEWIHTETDACIHGRVSHAAGEATAEDSATT